MSAPQEPPAPEPGVRVGIWRSPGRRLAGFFRPHTAACVRFLRLAWPGAAIGLLVAAPFSPTYGGLCMGTGLGTALDAMDSLLLGAVIKSAEKKLYWVPETTELRPAAGKAHVYLSFFCRDRHGHLDLRSALR